MILFLFGPDSYRLQQRLNILKQGFIKKYDQAGLNVAILDGASLTSEEFHKATLSAGLFAKKRLIVIKNIFANKKTTVLAEIAEELKKQNKDNILIITSLAAPKEKNDPLFAALKKADKIEEFPLLKAGQLYQYIQTQAAQQQITISSEAVNYLVEAVGDDLWRLHNELDKLANYKKNITITDAQLFIDSPLDDNIFNLMDALSQKDAKNSMRLLHDQLDVGANEFYLLTMLARQIKILLQVKETNGQGLALHPFVIKKSLAQVNKFSLAQLKKLYGQIMIIDQKLKSSGGKPNLLFDLFVVEMCK